MTGDEKTVRNILDKINDPSWKIDTFRRSVNDQRSCYQKGLDDLLYHGIVSNGCILAIEMLIMRGANVNQLHMEGKVTPLAICIIIIDDVPESVLRLLLRNGAVFGDTDRTSVMTTMIEKIGDEDLRGRMLKMYEEKTSSQT